MVNNEDIPFSEKITQWELSFELAQEINGYDELYSEFEELKTRVIMKKEISNEDNLEFLRIIRTQWKWLIRDGSNYFLSKIEERKTKGQEFSKITREIEKLKIGGQKDLLLEQYKTIFNKLRDLSEEAREKIFLEEYQEKQAWKFLIIGAIIGFILGLIPFLLQYFRII